MVTIVQKGDDILRKIAQEVPPEEIQSPHIKEVLAHMQEGIDSREDAVAIAAPQIGHSFRIFMIAKRAFLLEEAGEEEALEHMVFINPVITKRSRKKMESDEGCLSVDTWYGKTKRFEKVTVQAYNEHGEMFTRGTSGLLAQIVQHEIDHLEGILFTDHATDLIQLAAHEHRQNTTPTTSEKS